MKVCCVFSLESPHRGDSNEYTQYTIFQYKKENYPKFYQICSCGIFSKGLKIYFKTALVNEPSVLETLKFYCKYTLKFHPLSLKERNKNHAFSEGWDIWNVEKIYFLPVQYELVPYIIFI